MGKYLKNTIMALALILPLSAAAQANETLVGRDGLFYESEESELLVFSDAELRLSYIALGHVQTLDYNDKNDVQNYMGYQWNAGLGAVYKEEYKGYIKMASYGPTYFDAPIAPYGPVHTGAGDVGEYWGKKLLPRLHEWWIDVPLGFAALRAKTGLFQHVVASGLALGGFYNNYGVNLYYESPEIDWTFRFTVPDIEQKWYLGPKLIAEKEVFNIRYDSKAYFFETDATVTISDLVIRPYLGLLADMTPWARRSGVYAQRIDKEYLGTYGGKVDLLSGDFFIEAEAAGNFGKAYSVDEDRPDITHSGYMFWFGVSYNYDDKITPRAKFYYISGNKFTGDDITAGQISPSRNKEFSVYSPTNSNLADTHYQAFDTGPVVFASMGNGMNTGIPRPNTFGDPYIMTNLIAPNIGIDINPTDKLTVSFDYWYLNSQTPPIGADYDAEKDSYSPYTLPSFLGNEINLFVEYRPTENMALSFLGGIFFPGEYYRKDRGDADVLGVISAPRFDGGASNAWQAETAITFSY
jgi:hypothetical protein